MKNLDFRFLSPFYIRLGNFSDHLCVFLHKFPAPIFRLPEYNTSQFLTHFRHSLGYGNEMIVFKTNMAAPIASYLTVTIGIDLCL